MIPRVLDYNPSLNRVEGDATITGNLQVDGTAVINVSETVTGSVTITADLAVNGGDLTSTATTFNLLNATVTTLNIGGAATTVSIGAGAASTLNANFTTQINLNTAAIVSNQTTVALLNTTTTTVNAFGAATAISIGAATGTLTLANPAVNFALAATVPTLYGSAAANDDLTLEGTSHATKTTSYVILQPTGGNVGIGTTGPVGILQVTTSTTGAGAYSYFYGATGGVLSTNTAGLAIGWNYSNSGGESALVSNRGAGSVGGFVFIDNNAGSPTTIMTLLGSGNIGIGTAVPQSLLDVQGPVGTGAATAGILTLATKELTIVSGDQLGRINFNAPLESDGSDAILVGAAIWAQATATFSATVNTTDLIFAVGVSEAAVEQFRIASDGGLFAQTLLQQSAAGLVVEWDSTGKEIYAETSALRFKDNIRDYGGAARLTELRPKSWTDKVSGRSEVGLIAEEVAATVPELAVYDGDGQPIGVKYHKLSVLLLGRVTRLERALLAAGITPEMVQ